MGAARHRGQVQGAAEQSGRIGVPPACRKRARGGARYPFEQDRFADVWRVVREWRVYFDEFGVDAAEMDKAAPAFRHIDDISTPELRKLLP